MHCGLALSDKENSRTHEIVFGLHKEKIFHNMLKMEVFDLESTVNISSFCKSDVLHNMLTYLYGYQFSNSCEI